MTNEIYINAGSIEDIKNALRIDHDMDDQLLISLKWAAEEYIANAVDLDRGSLETNSLFSTRFNLAVLLLVSSWYFSREAFTDNQKNEIPFGVTSLIHQLRGATKYG